jgi:hypothetical protein
METVYCLKKHRRPATKASKCTEKEITWKFLELNIVEVLLRMLLLGLGSSHLESDIFLKQQKIQVCLLKSYIFFDSQTYHLQMCEER